MTAFPSGSVDRPDPSAFKSDVKPVWCPGCGDFGVLSAFTKAAAELGLAPEEMVLVSGIGCSSRLPPYTRCYGFHGVHGRALPVAAGLKIARPELTVLAVGGDGDGYSTGGNHFLHACRRNVDLTYVVMDNQVYGMTKGQPSPTAAEDWESALTPGGGHRPFEPLAIGLAAGAGFVARGFSGDPKGLAALLIEAIRHPGFAFLEVLSPCPTHRPEQRGWKRRVQDTSADADDMAGAMARVIDGDPFETGLIYRGRRAAFAPRVAANTGWDPAVERAFLR